MSNIRVLAIVMLVTSGASCKIDSLPPRTSLDAADTAALYPDSSTLNDRDLAIDIFVADGPGAGGAGSVDAFSGAGGTGGNNTPSGTGGRGGLDVFSATGGTDGPDALSSTGGVNGTGGSLAPPDDASAPGDAPGADAPPDAPMGGSIGTGGVATGGTGATATGGTATGGTVASGGSIGTGGITTGGVTGAGGTTSTGGMAAGGTIATGGITSTGGVTSAGGASGAAGGSGGTTSATPGWTLVGPGRNSSSMGSGYDALNDRMILFGGEDAVVGETTVVWVLGNASGAGGSPTWNQLATTGTPPQARLYDAVLYDSTRKRLIVHGGCPGHCAPGLADTWILSDANGLGNTPQWSHMQPDAPVGRLGHAAGFDEANRRLIVFGGMQGYAGTDRNDTWVMSEDTNGGAVWSQLSPLGTPPAARSLMAYYYNPSSNELVIFGGYTYVQAPTNYTFHNDVWVLSHANGLGGTPAWTQVVPSGEPPAKRSMATMVFDAVSDRALVFGGYNYYLTDHTLGDLWALSHPTGGNGSPQWLSVTPAGAAPAARLGHVAAYAQSTDRMIVTSGGNGDTGTWPGDTWVFQGGRQVQ